MVPRNIYLVYTTSGAINYAHVRNRYPSLNFAYSYWRHITTTANRNMAVELSAPQQLLRRISCTRPCRQQRLPRRPPCQKRTCKRSCRRQQSLLLLCLVAGLPPLLFGCKNAFHDPPGWNIHYICGHPSQQERQLVRT